VNGLHVTHVVLSLDVGGLERNVLNQVREGHALGQRVSVVCLERRGLLAPRVEELGATVVCLDKRPGIQITMVPRLASVFRSLRPHVVHTHQIPTLFYAGPAARRIGRIPVVHTEHGLPLFAQFRKTRWLGRISGLYCNLFFCLTREMAEETRKHRVVPGRKIRTIRNGIDLTAFQSANDPSVLRRSLGIPVGAHVVGSVGRLAPIKRFDMLIRAVRDIRRQFSDTRLLLVGDGPEQDALQRFARECGIQDAVYFVGYQSNVSDYLRVMDCFALTSSSEGTPQAVLEACVAGLPVVASRVGGLPEVIDDARTGLLFEPHDEADLTSKLARVLGSPDYAAAIGEAASRHVHETYGIDRMAAEYHTSFLDLVSLCN
jgi:glycosyltransferase involved in cell wall biosynthesis